MNEESLTKIRRNIINSIIGIEGGYSNDPDDSGGETKYGITHATASKHGYGVKSLTTEQAYQIYETDYWHPLNLDQIAPVSTGIATELFDTGVNTGPGNAAGFLQRALNSLNNGGRHYPDVLIDGDLGPQTLKAFHAYITRRGRSGESTLFNILNSMQSMYYIDLSERRPKDEKFQHGWQSNRVEMMPDTAPDPAKTREYSDLLRGSPEPEHYDPGQRYTAPRSATSRAEQKPSEQWIQQQPVPPAMPQQESNRMPWYLRFMTSKINMTTMATIVVTSGVMGRLELTPDQQSALIQAAAAIGGAGVLLLRTFFNNPK